MRRALSPSSAGALLLLVAAPVAATAQSLSLPQRPPAPALVDVAARALGCVFHPQCRITVEETVSKIPLPAGVTGDGRVRTLTATGSAGAPGAGKTMYQYRVDMSDAVSSGEAACVTDLTIEFGTPAKLQYDGAGAADIGFVVSEGGPGSIGILGIAASGEALTFTFAQPVCAGASAGAGRSSFVFGMASDRAPRVTKGRVGWPGLEGLTVLTRGPGP